MTDSGQTPYTGATVTDPLSGLLDDAAYDGDAAATTGTVSFASPDLTWTGDLAPGDAATITYTVTVNNPDTGDHILTSTLTSTTPGNNCPASSTDPRCTTTIDIIGLTTLTFTQSAAAGRTAPGAVVNYTITVANSGQSAVYRGDVYRPADRCAGRRRLRQRRGRDRGLRQLHQPEPDLDRNRSRRRHRHCDVLGHREEPRYRRHDPGQHPDLDLAGQ